MWLVLRFLKTTLVILPILFTALAAAQDIKDAKYYTSKGDEFFSKGRYKDAITNYSLAIGKDDKLAMAYANRGYSYVADYNPKLDQESYIKQLDKAITDCSTAIRLQPDSFNFYYYRSQAYSRKKLVDSSIIDVTSAINIATNSPAATNNELTDFYESRALLFQQKGLYNLTAKDYSHLIGLDSNNTDYYRNRCKAYYYSNEIDSALRDITTAFSFDTVDVRNNNYRGLCYNSLGQYEPAILDFLTYILRIPDHGNPYINIISPLVRTKRFAEAAIFYKSYTDRKAYKEKNAKVGDKKFESFLELDQYKFYKYYLAAVLQVAEGKYTDALASLDTASKQYGTEPKDETKRLYSDVLALNGYVLEKLNRAEDAKINYEQALVIDARQPDIGDALVGLQQKQVLTRSLDKSGPEITLISPAPSRGFEIKADTIKTYIIAQAKDPSGIASIQINNNPVPTDKIEPDGTFFTNLVLKSGTNSVVITATDKEGNTTTTSYKINNTDGENTDMKADQAAVIPPNYHAILIAENDYVDSTIPDLRNPIKDARGLKELLTTKYRFNAENIDTLYNRNREDIVETIIAKCKSLTDNDNLLIFYAGHGDTTHDKLGNVDGYLVPSSARKGLTSYYITSEEIKKALLKSNAKHVLILLDACYSGAFTRQLTPDAPNDIKKQYAMDSRKVMASGNLETVPDDSKFILFLTEFLKNNKQKYVSAKDLWSYVSVRITAFTSNLAQYAAIPGVGDIGGEFIFEMR